jgi:hypothetical protein
MMSKTLPVERGFRTNSQRTAIEVWDERDAHLRTELDMFSLAHDLDVCVARYSELMHQDLEAYRALTSGVHRDQSSVFTIMLGLERVVYLNDT